MTKRLYVMINIIQKALYASLTGIEKQTSHRARFKIEEIMSNQKNKLLKQSKTTDFYLHKLNYNRFIDI